MWTDTEELSDGKEIAVYEELFNEYKLSVESREDTEETYFEICGYRHFENVVSNVLAFFFDYESNHKLNGLFARSLLEAVNLPNLITDLQFVVEREVRTTSGRYIDLLLTNNTCTIVIENKIWAPLTNELKDYYDYAEKKNRELCSEKPIGIVLSIKKIEMNVPGYSNVRYSDFLSRIRANLGEYVTHRSSNYIYLLVNLIDHLESLESGVQMNEEFIRFVRTNPAKVEDFAENLKKYRDHLKKKVKEVNAVVSDKLQDINVKQWPARHPSELCYISVSDFKSKNGKDIAIDSVVNFEKWDFRLFPRNSSCTLEGIVDLCKSIGIQGYVSDKKYILKNTLPMDSDAIDVADSIILLVRQMQTMDI